MNGPDRTVASVTSVRSRLSGCGQAGCDSGAVNGDTGRASFPVAGKVEVVCQVMAVGVVFQACRHFRPVGTDVRVVLFL